MSIHAHKWALDIIKERDDLTSIDKLVLIGTSDEANSQGYVWPFLKTQKQLAEKMKVSRWSVNQSLVKLCRLKLVESELRKDAQGKTGTSYRLCLTGVGNSNKDCGKFQQGDVGNSNKDCGKFQQGDVGNSNTLTLYPALDSPLLPAYEQIVSDLNRKTRKAFKHTSRQTQALIKARLNEGFSVEDFLKVHTIMTTKWQTDSKMQQYLRPETLYGPKFESYLNTVVTLSDQNVVSPLTEKNLAVGRKWLEKKKAEEKPDADA